MRLNKFIKKFVIYFSRAKRLFYATYINTFNASLFIIFFEIIYINVDNSALIDKATTRYIIIICAYNITSINNKIILIVRRVTSLIKYLFYLISILSASLII